MKETIGRIWNDLRVTYKLNVFDYKTKKALVEEIGKHNTEYANYFRKVKGLKSYLRSFDSTLLDRKTKKAYVGTTENIRNSLYENKIGNKKVYITETEKYRYYHSSKGNLLLKQKR